MKTAIHASGNTRRPRCGTPSRASHGRHGPDLRGSPPQHRERARNRRPQLHHRREAQRARARAAARAAARYQLARARAAAQAATTRAASGAGRRSSRRRRRQHLRWRRRADGGVEDGDARRDGARPWQRRHRRRPSPPLPAWRPLAEEEVARAARAPPQPPAGRRRLPCLGRSQRCVDVGHLLQSLLLLAVREAVLEAVHQHALVRAPRPLDRESQRAAAADPVHLANVLASRRLQHDRRPPPSKPPPTLHPPGQQREGCALIRTGSDA